MIIVEIDTQEELMESSTRSTPTTTAVECLCLFRETGHTRPCGMMTGARMVVIAEFQSTQESLVSTQGQSLFKVRSIETKHT